MAVMPIILPRRAALPPLLAVCLLLAAAAVAPASAAGPRKLLQTAVPGNFQALVADAVSSATHSASGALALADAAAAAAAGGGAPSVAGTAASSTTSGGSYAQQYAQDPAVVSNVQEMINHALNRDAAVSAESSTAAGALRAAPAGSAAASSASGDILSLHNSYRARHSAPPMSWSSSLQASAQQWSNHLAAACSFYHSSSSGVGENLAYGQRDWTQVAAAWYDEVSISIRLVTPRRQYCHPLSSAWLREMGY